MPQRSEISGKGVGERKTEDGRSFASLLFLRPLFPVSPFSRPPAKKKRPGLRRVLQERPGRGLD